MTDNQNYLLRIVETVDDLVQVCVDWAQEQHNGKLTVHSNDGGDVIIRAGRNGCRHRIHKGSMYDAIEIEAVRLPVNRQREGLFKNLTSSLSDLGLYGMLFIESVQDPRFGNALEHNGFLKLQLEEVGPCSYYKIIGAPLEKSRQQEIEEDKRVLLEQYEKPKRRRSGMVKR